ncbi:hypothetical protein, partial [Franconibacter pulveris]|uniref:hypothetical protein n=1 Tax=Franconibacter pulveris TaxID=435910 RepID=UPI001F1FD6C3
SRELPGIKQVKSPSSRMGFLLFSGTATPFPASILTPDKSTKLRTLPCCPIQSSPLIKKNKAGQLYEYSVRHHS